MISRTLLCFILGTIVIVLPLSLTYGFSFGYIGNDIWFGIIVLLSITIPYLDNFILKKMTENLR